MQGKRISPNANSADHRALGRAIRQVRTLRIVSQEELGFRCGLHRNYVGAVERGEVNPTFRSLLSLAGGLSLPLSTLIALYERRAADAAR
jgi:transcriptional regulator with XRE-family HTH domain